ncbi:hypothetical protein H9P43_000555 [Blastocladiella emersonii ATCC 22665]|nr:hypothetical protein H9P43_000555 [Blastocladiella emersonii ATCC 22665]
MASSTAPLGAAGPRRRRLRDASHSILLALATVALLLPWMAEALKVRLIADTDLTAPFTAQAMRGCTNVASSNSAVSCNFSRVSGSLSNADLYAAWENLVINSGDDVYIGSYFGFVSTMDQLAAKYPAKLFVALDSAMSPPKDNTMGVTFAEDQAGYLAGALAGVFSTSKRVGVIGGLPIPPVKKFVNGYLAGVLSVCPTCEVYSTYRPSFDNSTVGQLAARSLIAQGADVIFGAGGGMGSAGILEAARNRVFAIGVDSNEALTTFKDRAEIDYLLSTAEKKVDVAISSAITSILAGKRGGFNMVLDTSLGGVALVSPFNSTTLHDFSVPVTVSIKNAYDTCATTSFSPRSTILTLIFNSLKSKLTFTSVVPASGDLQPLTTFANKTFYDMAPFGQRSSMPAGTQGLGAAMVGGNRILAWGGQTKFGEYPTAMMALDFDSFTWTQVADASSVKPAGRAFHALGYDAAGGNIWIYGGQSASSVLGDTWKYSVAAATWTAVTTSASPGTRTNFAHATLDQTMYVYGGVTPTGEIQRDLWALDMAAGAWSPVAAKGAVVPPALQHAALVAVNGTQLVLYGGTNEQGSVTNSLYVLDVPSKTWRVEQPSTLKTGAPPAAERMRAVYLDQRRVLFTGGLGTSGPLNATWVWKMDEGEWSNNAYGSLPAALHSHALVTFNQSAYAKACQYAEIPVLSLCTPATVNAVVAVSGVTNSPGGGVVVSFANPDPPPPPVGVIDAGAKWAVTVLNAVGLMLTLALSTFLWLKRGHKVIKASNVRFAALILLGTLLAHIGLIASSWVPDARTAIMLTAFLVGSGYTLVFSALVVKTYLIYGIFSSKRAVKRKMPKYFAAVVFALGIQLLLVGLWFQFDSNAIISINVAGTVWNIRSLDSNWVLLSSLPVILLTIAGVFLSFKTRHIASSFNESYYIGIATYSIALALIVVAPVILLLQAPLVQYIISAILVTLTTIGVQLIFFGHKVSAVFMPANIAEVDNSTASESSAGESSTGVLRCKYCKQALQAGSAAGGNSTIATGMGMGTLQGKMGSVNNMGTLQGKGGSASPSARPSLKQALM